MVIIGGCAGICFVPELGGLFGGLDFPYGRFGNEIGKQLSEGFTGDGDVILPENRMPHLAAEKALTLAGGLP
ncbi:hypothetical protein D081_2401 [Anaerovibrio sp. JC8]|nr:hypothetical protein D081_2401 [Anaerovibrio sp. JC8]